LDTKITIIGAGVIGLAIAADLSNYYKDVFVLEKNEKLGQETSSRNSEVIHSGIYYPTNSLKAKLCVLGNELLYKYCIKNEINYKKCGKLVIATNSEEEKALLNTYNQSIINGVTDGRLIEKDEAFELEPYINCTKAIYFPSTGIVDSHGLMLQLELDAINNQTNIVYNSEVVGISKINGGYLLKVKEHEGYFEFTTEIIINAAGLYSDNIAKMTNTYIPSDKIYFWKGEYFAVSNYRKNLINHLIYPVPHENYVGLGVHATIDLNNRLKLGPDASFISDNKIDYSVDKNKQKTFFEAARKYLPFLSLEDLQPDQAGIRPKLQKPGDLVRDFVIRKETNSGNPNIINLIGIESPGLTSCLAIGEYVRNLLLN
jgi:L-2-hydroxyglutarate oxidase LhgO